MRNPFDQFGLTVAGHRGNPDWPLMRLRPVWSLPHCAATVASSWAGMSKRLLPTGPELWLKMGDGA